MHEVPISAQSLDRFGRYLGKAPIDALLASARELQERLAGRVVWNINSTAAGGGVAELLRSLIAYVRGAGVNTRWDVITGGPEFFRITKRLHHALHGSAGDGSALGDEARRIYEGVARENAAELAQLMQPGDVVILHDPQTAGMIPPLNQLGAKVIWRCHVGTEFFTEEVHQGWAFLLPYLGGAQRLVFSRKAYVPPKLNNAPIAIIPPTIDPFSAKNQDLSEATVRAILTYVGVIACDTPRADRTFLREDGSPGRVDRCAEMIQLGPTPRVHTPLVVQVSRWDRLKDPIGVMRGFAKLLTPNPPDEAECLLVGPSPRAVADDPEGLAVFEELLGVWRGMPDPCRRRIHLVNLPMEDVEENAAIVNAIQRHATIVVQKSLREGFGLTLTEAMWKERAVIASAVGGLQDQLVDGESGLLLRDPKDLTAFGGLLRTLLEDPELRTRLGKAARARVQEQYLGMHSLQRYAELVASVLD